jgi:hypothetical protein
MRDGNVRILRHEQHRTDISMNMILAKSVTSILQLGFSVLAWLWSIPLVRRRTESFTPRHSPTEHLGHQFGGNARHADAARFDDCPASGGYWDGWTLNASSTIFSS